MKVRYAVLALCAAVFQSCATAGFRGSSDFTGLVIDERNVPVSGYVVNVKGEGSAMTNYAGRFTVRNVRAGTLRLAGQGKGYLDCSAELTFSDPAQVACLQVSSWQAAFCEAEQAALAGNYAAALRVLEELARSGADSERYRYDTAWVRRAMQADGEEE